MKIRQILLAILVAVLVGAACGDDDSTNPTTTAPGNGGQADGGTDSGSNGDTPTPSATGGFLIFGDETIELGSALCYLEEQPAAAGGGSILATAQASGTNAEGVGVSVDFTRYSEESQFAGDDLNVFVGDSFADGVTYSGSLDIGAVSVEGNTVSGSGFTLTSFDDGSQITASFELNC